MAGIVHAFVSGIADGADETLVRPSDWNAAHKGGTFVKAETRDMAAASGDVSYTGYGFTPTGLIIFASYVFGKSYGSSDPAKVAVCLAILNNSTLAVGAKIVYLGTASNTSQTAIVKTYDAAGFTLTWTKTGSPTETASLTVFAFS